MSTDRIARAAAQDLRAHTTADVNAGLTAVIVAHAGHRRRTRAAMAAVVAAAVAAGWWGGATLTQHGTTPAPAPPTAVPTRAGCLRPLVTCLGNRTYRFALDSPVEWRIPRGYRVNSGQGATRWSVESYSRRGDNAAGVSVLERVAPASRGFRAALHPGQPVTAVGFVHWLETQPFVNASSPRRTTIDGRPAWTVRVTLKRHLGHGPGRCTGPPVGLFCYPVTFQFPHLTRGLRGNMVADYTAFDLPRVVSPVAPTVVFSWAFGHDTEALSRNITVVAGLSWPDS